MDDEQLFSRCIQCQARIPDSTAMRMSGLCKHCFKKLASPSDLPRQLEDLVVCARFSPGFASDLTSWQTEIWIDGFLRQTIEWDSFRHPERGVEVKSTNLCDHQLDNLMATLASVDRQGIIALDPFSCIDDASQYALVAPHYDLAESIIPYCLELRDDMHPPPADAVNGLVTFLRAWDLIESFAPYSTKEHRK